MSQSRAKGTRWESRLVLYLTTHGFDAERRALAGSNDKGDIVGVPGVVFEAKNAKQIQLAAWIDEMLVEKKNAKASVGVVVFPRRNMATGRAYCVMELDQLIEMLSDE